MAFSVTILINAIDVSSQITGLINVTGKEGEARLARFGLNPGAGTINTYDYIGQSVTIDYTDSTTDRIFTGIVHLPTYDITTGLLSFICTDNLQESVELVGRAAVDILLPYFWDKSVFNDPEENWTYAQQIMSTHPGSFDKDVNGNVRVTDWQPKAIADYTFTDSTILNDSLSLSLAERRSITNSVKINFSSRYQRQWQRELTGSWSLGIAIGGPWFMNPTQLPSKSMVEMASSAWTIKSISYTNLPPSGFIDGVSWNLSLYAQTLCTGADIAVAKRWMQTVTDNYTITVASAASVIQHGLLEIEQKHTTQVENDAAFMDFAEYKAPIGALVETGNYINTNAADINNAINTATHLAKTRILESHRHNKVTFKTALNPDLDMDKTARVNHTKTQATGKVTAIEHDIDLINGTAISMCTIAVYLPNIASQIDDALTTPASPYQSPSGLNNALSALSTHLGNITGAVAEDANWNGFVGNYETWSDLTGAAIPPWYSTRFGFEIPEVTETNAVEFTGTSSVNIAIPQNELVIIK